MTIRIYYTDPSCTTFEGAVARAFEHDGQPAVVLDRTAFYPTSGGQPADRGRLGDTEVLDVVDMDEDIVHVLKAPLAAGAIVRGEIDWARRFDHMQQHTGQHLLSAAFERLHDHRTVSFHMGEDASTIDLDTEPTPATILAAVDEANRIVWENHPVAIRFVSSQEAAALPLRKPPSRDGSLRLIEVEGFDLSACGGTHVVRSGEVGVIAVLGSERFKGGARVSFVCGARAVRSFRTYRDAVSGSIRQLSVLPAELPAAIERLQGEAKELRKTVSRQQGALAVHDADALLARAADGAGRRVIVEAMDGYDAGSLKVVATTLVSGSHVVAALVSASTPVAVVVARSTDETVDANAIVRELTSRFGGRGGGKPDFAQAGGLTATPADVVAAARQAIEALPSNA